MASPSWQLISLSLSPLLSPFPPDQGTLQQLWKLHPWIATVLLVVSLQYLLLPKKKHVVQSMVACFQLLEHLLNQLSSLLQGDSYKQNLLPYICKNFYREESATSVPQVCQVLLKMRVAVLSGYYIWIARVLQGDTFLWFWSISFFNSDFAEQRMQTARASDLCSGSSPALLSSRASSPPEPSAAGRGPLSPPSFDL